MLSYEGLFFEKTEVELIHLLETEQLAKVNDKIHCTFKYHPATNEIFNDIVGKEFEVYIVGYGNDGKNSGFQLLLPDKLLPYYINYDEQNTDVLKVPHITASLAEGAKASNTKNLNFKALEKPIKLSCKFGYWIKNNNEEYLSYEPYTKNNIK